MEEKLEYRFRGLGVLTLCALLFAMGIWRFEGGAAPVSSMTGNRQLPIYCVETDKKQVALTFDAAWGNEDTRKILEILKKYQVKATFFMTGGWVEKYPEDVKQILSEGHDLGNHSQNHKNMSRLTDEECRKELLWVHESVKELTGYEMFLFRSPYGDYDNHVISGAKQNGYYPIQWDVDSLDWKNYGADAILQTVLEHPHLGNGSIILCHNGAKYTAQALEGLIVGLQEKGFALVPVSELIYREDYRMDGEGRQISGASGSAKETKKIPDIT